jgi:hypothetical protein
LANFTAWLCHGRKSPGDLGRGLLLCPKTGRVLAYNSLQRLADQIKDEEAGRLTRFSIKGIEETQPSLVSYFHSIFVFLSKKNTAASIFETVSYKKVTFFIEPSRRRSNFLSSDAPLVKAMFIVRSFGGEDLNICSCSV